MQRTAIAMRDHEESDRKPPRRIIVLKKRTTTTEAAEGRWTRDPLERDRHRHI